VVINVGSGAIRVEDIDIQWSRNIDMNLLAATTLFEEVISIFPKLQNVIFISTLAGSKIMVEPPLQYSVLKSALNVFAKHMAAKYARAGIRINVIAPGNLDFEGSVWDRKRKENPGELESYLNENVPSGRLVSTVQISKLVHFLLTENTDIFGQVIGVDGGQSI
jgi:NAD(P)-dependent dehydrogenase (short-subunit alcohol dehydrogenase family)